MSVSLILDSLGDFFTGVAFIAFLHDAAVGLLLIVAILAAFKLIQLISLRLLKGRLSDQNSQLLRKFFRYTAFMVAAVTIFSRLGIDLTALMGAAGIAGIAVGFAAQTSVSNIISGLFLISEKPFSIGDAIQVGEVTGIIQSIDLLAIKIQTYDNRYVRIPNETLIKSNVVNITRFPIRRMDFNLIVSYKTDLPRLKEILEDTARNNMYVLNNPAPLIIFDKFDASGITILLGLWFQKDDFLNLKNSMMTDLKKRFETDGITIPYPRMDVRISE